MCSYNQKKRISLSKKWGTSEDSKQIGLIKFPLPPAGPSLLCRCASNIRPVLEGEPTLPGDSPLNTIYQWPATLQTSLWGSQRLLHIHALLQRILPMQPIVLWPFKARLVHTGGGQTEEYTRRCRDVWHAFILGRGDPHMPQAVCHASRKSQLPNILSAPKAGRVPRY